jgi:hypothetical protein
MTAKKKATRRKLIPNRDAKVLDEANVTKIGTFGNSDRAQELRSETVKFPFKRDGFLHELISKDGSVCLVRRSKGNRQTHFEVVVLQWSNGRTWPSGRISPDGWHYPSSEQWGTYGWTYRDLAEARAKYHSLSLKWPEKLQAQGKNGIKTAGRVETAAPPSNAL